MSISPNASHDDASELPSAGGSPTPKLPNIMRTFFIFIRLECERLLTTRQGGFYLAAFIVLWLLLLNFVILKGADFILDQGLVIKDWSSMVFTAYLYVGLFLFPLATLFISANQTGGDRQRGTLRFLVLRCDRDSIFFSRFIAQVVIQYGFLIFTLMTILIGCIYHKGFAWKDLSNGCIIAANLALSILPFIALMALLSATVKSPRQATVLAMLIWALALGILSGLSHYFPILAPLKMMVPGMQFTELKDLQGLAMFRLSYIPLMQTVVFLVIGRFVMQREML